MTDEKKPAPGGPTPLEEGSPRPIRMTDLPARIRLVDDDDPLSISFVIEPYDVPEDGGDVLPFEPPKKKPRR